MLMDNHVNKKHRKFLQATPTWYKMFIMIFRIVHLDTFYYSIFSSFFIYAMSGKIEPNKD